MGFIKDLLTAGANQLGGGIVGTGMGLLLGKHNDARQIEQQEKLQAMQIAGNKEMIDYSKEKDYEMWLKTNYGAQKEQMKAAGINPALMYGMGGGGGVTTGGGAGGVTGGSAPVGGREIQDMLGMGIQMKIQEAQIDVMKSQAEKNRADAKATSGVQTELGYAQINNLVAGLENTKAGTAMTKVQTAIQELQLAYNKETFDLSKRMLDTQLQKIAVELDILQNDKEVSDETVEMRVKQTEENLYQTVIENALKKWQIKATEAGVKQTEAQTGLIKAQTDATKEGTKLTKEQVKQIMELTKYISKEYDLKKMQTEFNVNHPGLGAVLGENLNSFLLDVQKMGQRISQKLSQFLPW